MSGKAVEPDARSTVAVDDVHEVLHAWLTFHPVHGGLIRHFDEDLSELTASGHLGRVGRGRARASRFRVEPAAQPERLCLHGGKANLVMRPKPGIDSWIYVRSRRSRDSP